MQFPKVKSIKAFENYILHVVFSDGMEGDYDLSHCAGRGVFKSWDIDNNFYNVFIDPSSGAISWPGELDIDVINVYCTIKGISADTYLTKDFHPAY